MSEPAGRDLDRALRARPLVAVLFKFLSLVLLVLGVRTAYLLVQGRFVESGWSALWMLGALGVLLLVAQWALARPGRLPAPPSGPPPSP